MVGVKGCGQSVLYIVAHAPAPGNQAYDEWWMDFNTQYLNHHLHYDTRVLMIDANTALFSNECPGARLRDMGRGNHAITALAVIKRNEVKMIKNS